MVRHARENRRGAPRGGFEVKESVISAQLISRQQKRRERLEFA